MPVRDVWTAAIRAATKQRPDGRDIRSHLIVVLSNFGDQFKSHEELLEHVVKHGDEMTAKVAAQMIRELKKR